MTVINKYYILIGYSDMILDNSDKLINDNSKYTHGLYYAPLSLSPSKYTHGLYYAPLSLTPSLFIIRST